MNNALAVRKIVSACEKQLDWSARDPDYASYVSLPLCILDAVFSINAKYESVTKKVVARYAQYCEQQVGFDPGEQEQPVGGFLELVNALGPSRFAAEVLRNRQRTSARSGILKAEAAASYAAVLIQFGVQRFTDVPKIIDSDRFCRRIRAIPGQVLALDYFLMLVGRDDLIKGDRMVLRFLGRCLEGAAVKPYEALDLLTAATEALRETRPTLTPRLLDWMIWQHEHQS